MKYCAWIAAVLLTAVTGMAEIIPTVVAPAKLEPEDADTQSENRQTIAQIWGAVPESYFGTFFGECTPEKRPVSVKIYYAKSSSKEYQDENFARVEVTLFDSDGNEEKIQSCSIFRVNLENEDIVFCGGKARENDTVSQGDIALPVDKGMLFVKVEKQPDTSLKIYSIQFKNAPKGKDEVYTLPAAELLQQLEERHYTKTELADLVFLPALSLPKADTPE